MNPLAPLAIVAAFTGSAMSAHGAAAANPERWELRDHGAGVVHCVEGPHFTVCDRLGSDGVKVGEPIEIWWGYDAKPVLRSLTRWMPIHTDDDAVIDWSGAQCRFSPGQPGELVRATGCDVVVRWTADISVLVGGILEIR